MSPTLYSTPGNSRNGNWNADRAPTRTIPVPHQIPRRRCMDKLPIWRISLAGAIPRVELLGPCCNPGFRKCVLSTPVKPLVVSPYETKPPNRSGPRLSALEARPRSHPLCHLRITRHHRRGLVVLHASE